MALDEAHEIYINKDLKAAVVHPTDAYLQKTTLFFNDKIKAYKNLIQQLFPERSKTKLQSSAITDDTPQAIRQEENVKQMCSAINANKLFQLQSSNRGVINVFTGQKATPEQANDMLSCRQIGTQSFQLYINYRILKQPSSTNAPIRRKRILTMSSSKPKRQRANPRERETKQVIQCLRRKLAWCKHNTQSDMHDNEQFSLLPRAIADEDGCPHKGNKSHWTDKLLNRYRTAQPTVFTNFPLWTPQVVLIDAMFLINIRPLRRTKTITDYSILLFNQVLAQYYRSGTDEVHLIFDKPGRQPFNPKSSEHHRRYNKNKSNNDHQHCCFSPTTTIPPKWQEYMDCQQCKQSVVESIGLFFTTRKVTS